MPKRRPIHAMSHEHDQQLKCSILMAGESGSWKHCGQCNGETMLLENSSPMVLPGSTCMVPRSQQLGLDGL